ncbi:MAG: hypothetical protein GY896_03225 [Gammaproteobacteria bacterium]|nr:hypothetical protein [Gammaproteobacteria bacterium]
MNNYEDWAKLVAKRLKGEADVIAAIEKDELDDAAATDAFVRAVLEPFLPENFGVGSGRIVDAFGNYSDHLDVIVYNRDFPRIGMRGASSAYLYESVLAAFALRAKFIRKTFFESMNACASLAHLETNIDKTVLVKLAKKNGLKPGPNKKFLHEDPLRTARFELIGRPPAFVFGFSGIKNSYRQLQENIELWIDNRLNVGIETPMKALPAVIATQGCFAWRNAAPLALSNREMLGIGNDDAPVRLIVLQMLYLLNRRLNVTSDGYGLKPSLNAYLSQFSAPKFEFGVGDVARMTNPQKPDRDTMRFEPARDHTPAEVKPAATPESPKPPVKETAPAAETKEPASQAAVFDKPSPFAAAPAPAAPPAVETEPMRTAAPATPLGSAPIPTMSPPATPLGSAPIPSIEQPAEAKPATAPLGSPQEVAPATATPPQPLVDFDLGGGDAPMQDKPEPEEDEFINTVVIPPNATASNKNSTRNSTDAFIARVKEQLSSSDPLPESEQDPFSSTIPQ